MNLITDQDCNKIIDRRLEFSYYHKILFTIIGLILLADGSEALSLSLMLPCIIEEFKLNMSDKKIISTIYYVGVLIGAISGGTFADKHGRKNIFTYTCLFTSLLGFFAYMITNYTVFLIVRFFFGVLIGVVGPLSVSIITESFPTNLRGRIFILCRIGKMVGELFSAVLGAIFLEKNLKQGNWRALLFIPAIPAFICFLLAYKFLVEPPRYFLAQGNFEESEKCFKMIYEINQRNFSTFNNFEKNIILAFYDNYHNGDEKMIDKMKALFKEKIRKITILTWCLWMSVTFIFYGATFVLPIILAKTANGPVDSFWNNPFTKIISPILAEIPAALICSYLIDHPHFGRKNSLLYSLFLAAIAYLLCLFVDEFYFVFFLVMARFSLVLGYSIKYTYTSELYHTSIRSTAVGAASACGRIGGIIMPLVFLSAVEVSLTFPFFILFIVCMIAALVVKMFPYDTSKRQLDFDF